MADNKTISKLQINKTTYDLAGSGSGSPVDINESTLNKLTPSDIFYFYSMGNKILCNGSDTVTIHPIDSSKFTMFIETDTPIAILLDSSDSTSTLQTILTEMKNVYIGEITSETTVYDCFQNLAIRQFSNIPFTYLGSGKGSISIMQNTLPSGSGEFVWDVRFTCQNYNGLYIGRGSTTNPQTLIKDIPMTLLSPMEPINDTDAANKKYVDTQIASVKPSVQKIEDLVIEPAEQYGWINRSADILVDLYIGEDVIGYPEMYGSIKIPIAQGSADYADDYMRGSYFKTRYKTNNDLYKLKDLLSDYGYNDRPYTVVFLAAQAVSPNSIGFFTWCDDSYNINESSIFDVGFTPGGAVYDDETYLTLVPKLIRL